MLFKISNLFFYIQKVAYFVFKESSSPVKANSLICSTLTYLRCIADQTRSRYDQSTLYRRDHAVPPLNIRPVESGIPTIFQPLEKLIPLTTTSQSGPDQPPLYFRPTYALPDQGPLIADPSIFPERERAGDYRISGRNGP